MGWRGWAATGQDTKRKLNLRKRHFFVIEKCFEDVRHDGERVPDLLESIISPKLLVKEELLQFLFKTDQIRSKIKKLRVSSFWIPEIQKVETLHLWILDPN